MLFVSGWHGKMLPTIEWICRTHLEASSTNPAGRTVQPCKRIEQRYAVLSS